MDAMEQAAGMSPEEQATAMEAWMAWAKKCGTPTWLISDPHS